MDSLASDVARRYCRDGHETLSRFENGKLPEFGSRKLLAVLAMLGMELTFEETRARGSLDELRRERAGNL